MSHEQIENFKREAFWSQSQMRHYQLILQATGEGICGTNEAGIITFINSAAAAMLGWKQEETVGRKVHEVLFRSHLDDEYELNLSPIQFVLGGGEIAHVNEEEFFRQDGSEFLVEYVCLPMIEEDSLVGAVITFQNITERRDLEIAAIEVREAALQTARFKAAFLANMSHEVRTPLNGIIGMTDLLLETKMSGEQLRYMKMLKHSADALLHLVDHVLDFSKAEAGKVELEVEPFDLRHRIQTIADIFRVEARKKNLFLNVEIAADVPQIVCGDTVRLRQILSNLVSNALKFTSEGGVKLKISVAQENEQSISLHFSVEDTGPGIASDIQKLLFHPFIQADASMTRRFGGTGLGLAISKELVQIMNGEIGLESSPGAGSIFWFIIPFEKASPFQTNKMLIDAAPAIKKTPINKPVYQHTVFEPLDYLPPNRDFRILVAEDNVINQEVTTQMLAQLGYQADVVTDGWQAVEAVAQTKYDVVLMDCQMPVLDGYEATEQIRLWENSRHRQHTSIVAMTANASQMEADRCLEVGMNDFLSKPFSREALKGVLEKQFQQEKKFVTARANFETENHPLAGFLDKQALGRLLEIEARGKQNFVAEMLQLYFDHAEHQIKLMRENIRVKSSELLSRAAHALKGGSGNVGLAKVFDLCDKIEDAAKNSSWQQALLLVAQIEHEVENVRQVWLQVEN